MLITTKLQRPQAAPDLVQRPRLYAALERARTGKMMLICAPAGYGKSSLVSSWLESSDHAHVWISLDPSDSDLSRFLGYLVGSLQQALPQSCSRLSTILQSATLPPIDFIVANIINDLDEFEFPLIIVLDDFHFIENDGILELMSSLLRYLPQQIHLVIITREDPNLPLVQMRARHRMADLRMEQLRFTEEEATGFLQRALGDLPYRVDVERLASRTEGWPVGLRLAALTVHESSTRTAGSVQAGMADDGLVMDYLVAEVLAQAGPDMRNFMLRTALCDRLCVELCRVLLDEDASQSAVEARINSLKRTNLFVVELDHHGRWWRYHHLFQELLQHEIHHHFAEDVIAELHGRAGRWYASHGFLDDAFSHFLAAQDVDAAVSLIEQSRYTVMNSDQWHMIERWLARVPDAIKQSRPALIVARAWIAYYHHRLTAIPTLLKSIDEQMAGQPNMEALRAEVGFFHALGLFWQGETAQALSLLDDVLVRLPPDADQARGETEMYCVLSRQMLGRKEDTLRSLYHDLYSAETPSAIRKTRLLGALAFLHLLCGNLDELSEVSSQGQQEARAANNAYVDAWFHYLLGFYHFIRNELDAARDYFAYAVEQRYVIHTRAAIDSIAGLALTYQAQGHSAQAEATLALLHEFATATDELAYVAIARTAQARVMLLQGRPDAAARRLETTALETDVGILFFFLEIPRITACRVQISRRDRAGVTQCVTQLEALGTIAAANHNVRQLIDIDILRALAYRTLKQDDEAQDALNSALDLAAADCWIRPFLEVGPDMADFLREQSARHPQRAFVDRLLATFPVDGKRVAPATVAELPETLTDREMDVLQLLAQRLSNEEIAAELVVSVATVKRHTANIYQKFHVNKRRDAVAKAREIGQLPPA